MRDLFFNAVFLSFISLFAACEGNSKPSPQVQSFEVDLSKSVPRMLDLIKNTRLPDKPEYPGVGGSYGLDLDVLKTLKNQWIHDYDWQKDQSYMNSFHHFKTRIESLDIHFIHEKSEAANAIPIILFHGWPGSFLEFLPLIKNLTQSVAIADGTTVSFDIIIPSLPGFAFSQAPPANWTVDDTARVMNSLMIDVLGYEKYAVHGTDWGSGVAYSLYDRFSAHVKASHFVFIPFYPKDTAGLAELNITLDNLETFKESRFISWETTGLGYFNELTTEPNTIGLSLFDNPVGQLAFIGHKYLIWSDPRQGTPPSTITHSEILRTVSLYYLTQTIVSSGFIYAQNPNGFKGNYTRAQTDAPLLFSAFKYNVGFWPPALVAKVGNLVSYKNHEFGGHFPGLDNPPEMVEDLRDIRKYWSWTSSYTTQIK